MDFFPAHVTEPSATNNNSSNNSTNGRDLLAVAAAQETVIQVAASFLQRQEVVNRLIRYRDYYDVEITRQQERMVDIARALDNFGRAADTNNSRRRAIEVLTASLEDAHRCLNDAQLAKSRLELEIGQWTASVPASA
ncbi:hypothetical protein LPJ66_007597 [Kickxella alabastrina]|uniref:Uncharacterized protein n=1 Tax=Kickxella alabastrina TaxID=61397 RepID=A0ACC1I933_9FUNG|nr:hypothetical protein LPJ66_007597 [Kickxella alabastrina]